ncbi:MAG TPA: zinc-dependent alcohol dehydrogenase [Deltaproteobacteria bacterium]|jgi:threonine dehydrogenase-like Zn-dependent dehydrogenase|nr:zinc-dependent alcohol dehydrogenase [Deltaproteobacteria bacterium]HOI06003.1 zinc-dependent alcohol dehydrogenase [Deltaproteobacteria bacterium]
MKAACWEEKRKVAVQEVPDPSLVNPHDIIVRVTNTTICGSDLHLYDGVVPSVHKGDIIGHEPVGEVVDKGPQVKNFRIGDRVVVSSVIGCGECFYCRRQEYSLCDNSNPNSWMQEKLYTYGTAGIFGYSHLFGGYPGAQAQYLRVPYADVNAFVIPDGISDEQALSISDAFPTGFMGAELCGIEDGDTVVVWGAGPVGQFVMKSAWLLGAGRVVAVDNVPHRLNMAREHCCAETIDFEGVNVSDTLREMTAGRGPDCCVDACGMEAHGTSALTDAYDKVKQTLKLETDRGHVVRQMIEACRKGGTAVIMGVYAMFVDKFPLGAAFNKGIRLRMGQMHGPRYIPALFDYTLQGKVDPSFVFTHRFLLDEIPRAYEVFRNKEDNCMKVLVKVA